MRQRRKGTITQCLGRWPCTFFAAAAALAATSTRPSPSHAVDPAPEAATPPVCTLKKGPTRTVSRIVDAETVVLDDGSEVRLVGALSPRARDNGAADGSWPAENSAFEALSTLALGRTIELAHGARRKDRYGRLLAQAFVELNGTRTWIQGTLLSQGMARAYALPGSGDCLAELLAREHTARQSGVGLWSSRTYRPIPADRTNILLQRRSTFQVVSGKVQSVSRTRSAVYLNFGADWRTDFTVKVPLPLARTHPEWGAGLDQLKGKDIEVRGWIERSNGPLIEISQPDELSTNDPIALASGGKGTTTPDRAALRDPVVQEPDGEPPVENEERPKPQAPGALDL